MTGETMTLGELIEALKKFPYKARVSFDFCERVVTEINSYRGDYSHLALSFGEWKSDGRFNNVEDLIERLRSTVGRVFLGYKGGEYIASLETPVWVDLWGESTGTSIVGLRGIGDPVYHVIIETKNICNW